MADLIGHRERPRMNRRGRVILLLIGGILVPASLVLNGVLYARLRRDYASTLELRLDPTLEGIIGPRNAALRSGERRVPRVLLLGDSRIWQWKEPPQLARGQFVNRGVGGETTAQVLLRLQRDALELKPDVAVIQVGINDLKCIGVFPDHGASIQAHCVRNIREICERLVAARTRVLLLTVFPVGDVGVARRLVWSEDIERAVEGANRIFQSWDMEGLRVVDCDAVLKNEGRVRRDLYEDTLHLNADGYAELNALLARELRELSVEVAAADHARASSPPQTSPTRGTGS